MTLNDIERRNSRYVALVHRIRQILRPIISQWLKPIRSVKYCLPFLLLAKTITHPAARSLCDSWASCIYTTRHT